ncbi:hypothetical protein LCGC14_0429260 [marine sediment metagenome]|uniref:Uncharacterized protein n=1 Tax=marine sediment metagenome TaxID=412755 RepID=A0A0F9VY53_9ZZZZ
MGLEPWGEWVAAGLFLVVGFGAVYGKLRSLCTQVESLSDRVDRNYNERLRIWERLDEHSVEIAKLTVKVAQLTSE